MVGPLGTDGGGRAGRVAASSDFIKRSIAHIDLLVAQRSVSGSGQCIVRLSKVASDLWDFVSAEPRTLDEITNMLSQEYKRTPPLIRDRVVSLVADIVSTGALIADEDVHLAAELGKACLGAPGGPVSTAYTALSEELQNLAVTNRIPIRGGIDLLSACNLRCKHCYATGQSGARGLPTNEVRRIIDEAADAGCLWFLLTGGEPFIRRDFPQIYLHAKARGLIPTVFSNATLVSDEIASLLGEYPPLVVEVSIYGATRETYERVTRRKGAYDACMLGVEKLAAHGVPLCLKAMLLRDNFHEVDGVRRLAQKVGARFKADSLVFPRLDGSISPLNQRLTARQVAKLDFEIPERRRAWLERIGRQESEKSFPFACNAGRTFFHVGVNGDMHPCVTCRLAPGGADTSLEKQWRTTLPLVLRDSPEYSDAKCRSCSDRKYCNWCPGFAQLEQGDHTASVPFLCEVAAERRSLFESA